MGGARTGGAGASSKLRKAAKKMVAAATNACGSFSRRKDLVDPVVFDHTNITTASISGSSVASPTSPGEAEVAKEAEYTVNNFNLPSTKNLCAICLDPLSYHSKGSSPGQAIFTAQCSHAFHFACISSNVRHGSVTCPICRALWTQLPRNLNPPRGSLSSCNRADPILQILDESIATFRIHRRSFLRSAHYDDDDPIEPDHVLNCPRLQLSVIPISASAPPSWCTPYACPYAYPYPYAYHAAPHHLSYSSSSLLKMPTKPKSCTLCAFPDRAFLSVKLAHRQATDLVLVASPNGPHLRLLKQCMALVIASLRPVDRLAIVTYSSAAARVFPLRRMTSYGKRTAQQVIDRLFYMGQSDPVEGMKKGIKILEDRAYKNPESCILHLSGSPTQSYHAAMNMDMPIPVHHFDVGFGFGTSNGYGYIMHELEEFLARLIGGMIREIQLRIRMGEKSSSRTVSIGELRGGEERKILVDLDGCGDIFVGYSYIEEGAIDKPITTGETMVNIVGDSNESNTAAAAGGGGGGAAAAASASATSWMSTTTVGRSSSAESWDYHDPYMARRWAKHLHCYRL